MRLWPWIGLAAGFFCIGRGIVDVVYHNYLWGVPGIVGGALLLLTRFRIRAVKLDLTTPTER